MMKRILFFIAILLHVLCNADSVTFVTPEVSLNPIVSGIHDNISNQCVNSIHTIFAPNPITLSTQHRSCRHHTATPQYDLNRMNTEQLAWYFAAQNYTEADVLSHPMLYMNQAYLALVKQLPRYPEFVKKYYEEYRKHKGTFFPADWPREKVIEKIKQAYDNFIKSGALPSEKGGKYMIDGLIDEGIKIRMYITKNGVLKTAYPLLE